MSSTKSFSGAPVEAESVVALISASASAYSRAASSVSRLSLLKTSWPKSFASSLDFCLAFALALSFDLRDLPFLLVKLLSLIKNFPTEGDSASGANSVFWIPSRGSIKSVFRDSMSRGTIFPTNASSFANSAIGKIPAMSIVLIFIKKRVLYIWVQLYSFSSILSLVINIFKTDILTNCEISPISGIFLRFLCVKNCSK